jgi:hypothetical protein
MLRGVFCEFSEKWPKNTVFTPISANFVKMFHVKHFNALLLDSPRRAGVLCYDEFCILSTRPAKKRLRDS